MGWIYAIAAWISLVLITGITAFMVNPGAWLDPARRSFWTGFFNPQFIPQTVARTGGALLLSSLYVYLHASITIKDRRLHDLIARRSARPALLGAILVTVGGLGWYVFLPPSAKAALESAAVLTVLTVLIFALTAVVFALLYLGPYRNPGWLSPGFAGALALLGIAAFSTGEFIREAVRKPYVIYNVVLGSQIFPDEVAELREAGFLNGSERSRLEGGSWIRAARPLKPSPGELGQVLFMYHCNDCHAATAGYSAVAPMIRGGTPQRMLDLIEHLDEGHFFMPPWAGTREEARLLAEYLESIAPARPAGMLPERPAPDKK
jgi:mono/diheme cytochrome c family protein